jgi:signal peptidase II
MFAKVLRWFTQPRLPWWQGALLALCIFRIDQAIKHLCLMRVGVGHTAPLWPGVVGVQVATNPGIAWSGLAQHPDAVRWGATLLVLLLCGVAWRIKHPALWCVVGGAVSNVADRWVHGAVVDYIALQCVRFPIFNVADAVIVLAAVWLAAVLWQRPNQHHLT